MVKAKRFPVSIPAGAAVEFTATRKFRTGDLFYFVDYILVDGEKVIKFRFCGNEPGQIKNVADACLLTFRIDPAAKTNFQVEKEPSLGALLDQLKGSAAPGAQTPVNGGTSGQ